MWDLENAHRSLIRKPDVITWKQKLIQVDNITMDLNVRVGTEIIWPRMGTSDWLL
jgi:hypothetical protein